jgi:MYXO-CTERM domain-containing protein
MPADPGASEDVPITPACPEGDESCTSGSAGAGGEIPDVEPEPMPITPECEAVIEKICFPKRVDCTNDTVCAADETCTDFSEMYSSPSWWEDGETAIACMPEGLVMAFQGHTSRGVEGDYGMGGEAAIGEDLVTSPTNQTDTTSGVDPDEGVEKVDHGDEEGDEGETIGTGNDNESEASDDSEGSSDSGCSVARVSGNASSSWLLLIVSALVFGSIRRRRS